jgi:hypothetical protein
MSFIFHGYVQKISNHIVNTERRMQGTARFFNDRKIPSLFLSSDGMIQINIVELNDFISLYNASIAVFKVYIINK